MSRRKTYTKQKSSDISSGGLTTAPRSHPSENIPEHRQFLIRSLERNDTEIAALMDLNRSLHSVKRAIIRTCGENTLLDLGQGKLTLASDRDELVLNKKKIRSDNKNNKEEDDDKNKDKNDSPAELSSSSSSPPSSFSILPATQEGQHLCVDFLLRQKLRTRLLNRLVRRLHRVAHAMDGNDVYPPGPPKYGDLRLHIDAAEVQEFVNHFVEKEEALRKLVQAREEESLKDDGNGGEENAKEKQDEADKAKQVGEAVPEEESKKVSGTEDEVPQTVTATETSLPTVPAANAAATDEETEKNDDKMDIDEPTIGDQPPTSTQEGASLEGDKEKTSKDSDALPKEEEEEGAFKTSAEAETSQTTTEEAEDEVTDPLEACYEVLRDYKEVYEKIIDPSTGQVHYTVLDHPHEEDYMAIKFGAGVGAQHRSMSTKEKETEFKRWRSSLLSRIPDQPTFEELGMKHRVFQLEERRKRALKESLDEEHGDKEEEAGKSSPKKKVKTIEKKPDAKEGDDDDESSKEDAMEVDDDADEIGSADADETGEDDSHEKDETEEGGKTGVDDVEDKDELKDMDKAGKNGKEKAEDGDAAPAISKPISLAAVPSFYYQDLKRIKMVHADLMATSIQEHARRRLEEVTRDYNAALALSNRWYDRLVSIKTQLHHLHQQAMARSQSDYKAQLAIAQNHYLKRRHAFEVSKLNKILPSRYGAPATGTHLTQKFAQHDSISRQVADVLADVIDSVDNIEQGVISTEKFTEPFVPPPPPSQVDAQQEAALRREYSASTEQLRASEEERNRCWKKMLKTKADFELPHQRMDPNRYNAMPAPPLRTSTSQTLPRQAARPTVAVYTPAARPRYPSTPHQQQQQQQQSSAGQSQSKYSAARVRQRIAADGTVAPVSEPKKTKDGLYQRPAGRTRKGMEWDAVRGIWVPSA